MLRKAPSPSALRALRLQFSSRPFTCTACHSKRSIYPARLSNLSRPLQAVERVNRRTFSQPAAVTSVGAKPAIPSRLKDLHDELSVLSREGANYTNLSQLSLALKGLETEDATVRIAVLATNGSSGAKRLVRALLADPLSSSAEWEASLLRMEDSSKGILIRYAEDFSVDDRHPLVKTLFIPSTLLQRNKLEILVSETNVGSNKSLEVDGLSPNLLVPMLGTPSAHGHTSLVAYPVHKTLVFGDGMDGARDVFRATEPRAGTTRQAVVGVLNVSWRDEKPSDASSKDVLSVNLAEGEAALASFRKSVENATAYERGWLDSNIDTVLSSVVAASAPQTRNLKPALHILIQSLLGDTKAAALVPVSTAKAPEPSTTTTATRQPLDRVISSWSEASHTELRDSLTNAFHSRAWRKLNWWKLPWRVDDTGLILGELVQRAYLPRSEKGLVWVSGRIQQAGLLDLPEQATGRKTVEGRLGRAPSDQQLHAMAFPEDTEPYQPWPTLVGDSRKRILASIPAVQTLAQSFLLRALSTNALFSTVAALSYVMDISTSLFEAGAVTSLGLVISARYLQKNWERAKSGWVATVEEEGRRVLVEAEAWARGVVETGSQNKQLQDDAEVERETARGVLASVDRCEVLLEQLKAKQP